MAKKSGIDRIVIDPVRLRTRITASGYKSLSEFGRAIGMNQSHVTRMCRVSDDPYDLPDAKLSMMARIVNALGLSSMDPIVRYLPVRKSTAEMKPEALPGDPDKLPSEST